MEVSLEISSEVLPALSPSTVSVTPEFPADRTPADAVAHARNLLRTVVDPRELDRYLGIRRYLPFLSDAEMSALQQLVCGVLSIHDRRPWSSNGTRVTVANSTTYLGITLQLLSMNFRLVMMKRRASFSDNCTHFLPHYF
jgi:hypothetical protein